MIFRDFEFVHGFEKSRTREAWKIHFCTARRVSAPAHYNLGFDNVERQSGRSDDNHAQKFSYHLDI